MSEYFSIPKPDKLEILSTKYEILNNIELPKC